MCIGKIYKRSTALVVDFSGVNSSGSGITGLTVKFSIYDVATSKYWDNASGAFDSVAEVLNTAAEIGDGLYNYVLTAGYALGGTEFVVHTEATQTVAGDIYDTAETYLLTGLADIVMVNGSLTDGYNATLKLKKLDIQNSAGDAISAVSTGANGSGFVTTGNGSGHGHISTGGATGHGKYNKGGSNSGHGMYSEAIGVGDGTKHVGQGGGAGQRNTGSSAAAGVENLGGGGGAGGPGTLNTGQLTAHGTKNVGGATGHGVYNLGGATSGHGTYSFAPTLGAGIRSEANGLNMSGAVFVKGTGTGKDIEADEIGDITTIGGSATIDTISITTLFELLLAQASGKILKGTPSAGKMTVYKQNGSTVLKVFDITSTLRDPV